MRFDPSKATVQTGVAVMSCDSSATLEETLQLLAELELHAERVGPAAIAFPARELSRVRQALRDHAIFPSVIGRPRPELGDDESLA